MKANKGTYLLSMIDHKAEYQLNDDITLQIDKTFENNLRERNPQLGVVEAICEENDLNLKVGDIVAVQHFTFYGDIGPNKSFTLQEHIEIDGKKYFRVYEWGIFFKYNNQIPAPVGNFILCDKIIGEKVNEYNEDGIWIGSKEYEHKGIVTYGNDNFKEGEIVIVLKNAFYSITLNKKEYFKVREDEVVGIFKGDKLVPKGNNLLIEEEKEIPHPFLIGLKKINNLRATLIDIGDGVKKITTTCKKEFYLCSGNIFNVEIGSVLRVYRNQGVKYKEQRIIDIDSLIGVYE